MSTQIDVARNLQFNANVFHLAQQKGSRLRGGVRNEMQQGKAAFYDRIGAVSPVKLTGRHTPTPRLDTPHTRRMVVMNDYVWSDQIDAQDKIRMLMDPTSEYAKAAAWSLGRGMDDEIIGAAIGNAYGGETGSSSVALGNGQRIAANSTTTHTNLSINALIGAKQILDGNDVDPDEERFICVNASAIASLLQTTQVTNSQYNTVKALVEGNIDTFMGFKFIRSERLLATATAFSFASSSGLYNSGGTAVTLAATVKSCFAWAKSGLLLSSGLEITTRIDELPTNNYSTQVYARGSFGATRMEEAKVVEIICNQA